MGLSVCLCVCLSVKSHLTYGASVRPENAVTYSAGNEGQKICGDLPETTAFKSCAAKHERKSQYANKSTKVQNPRRHTAHIMPMRVRGNWPRLAL